LKRAGQCLLAARNASCEARFWLLIPNIQTSAGAGKGWFPSMLEGISPAYAKPRHSWRGFFTNSSYAPERKRSSNDANERNEIFAYLSVHSMTNSYRFFFLRNMGY
jgi:hypothetical protein